MNSSNPLSSAILAAGMRAAATEARRWLGATSPNPPVGAAALSETGEILAVAAHRRAGTDHAEAALLKLCREQDLLPRIHTLCVTLEPCNHYGRTPPCSEAIIEAGIRHVIIGAHDPNPHVKGGGSARLREAGIHITENVESDLCQRLIHAYAFHAGYGRPFMTVKRAFDAWGSMIPPLGQKTFTSPDSLKLAHRLRKKADAIITGSGTILADRPLFNVRHVEDHLGKKPILAILDRRGRVPDDYLKAAATRGLDVEIFTTIDSCLLSLKKHEVNDVLVEAGPILSRFVLDSNLWAIRFDIHAGNPDKIEVICHPALKLPFDSSDLDFDSLLPL